MSLDEIKELFTLRDGEALTCQAVHEYLFQKVQQLNEQIKGLQKHGGTYYVLLLALSSPLQLQALAM